MSQENKKWNVLGISGSTRINSVNNFILEWIMKMCSGEINLNIYSGISALPHFNPDLDDEKVDVKVTNFRNLVGTSDGIIICTPEYAHGVPGTLKNAIDWTVSVSGFYQKPTVLITASTDGSFGHRALMDTLNAIGCRDIDQLQLLISFVKTKITPKGEITNADTIGDLQRILSEFLKTMNTEVIFE